MAPGSGKDRADPANVLEATNPITTETGTPRAAPAEAASPPPCVVVEQPGEERIPSTSGSAAAAVDREVSPSPSSHASSTGSTSSADAAEDEESAKSSAPPPSPDVPSPASCSRGSAATFSVDAEVTEQLSRRLAKDTRLAAAAEKQVTWPQANEETFFNQSTAQCKKVIWPQAEETFLNHTNGHCKNKLAEESGYDEDFSTKRKLGNKIPLLEFADKYKGNNTFMQKFRILHKKYCLVRRTAGDGSCFYRSFIFSYLEKAMAIPDRNVRINEAIRLRERIENGMQSCLLGLHRMTDAQFERAFSGSEFVMKLIEDGLAAGELYEKELTDGITSRILPLLRSLAEIELCTRESYYKWFLTDHDSIYELCVDEVRPAHGEATNLTIQALVNALGIAAIIGCVDMSAGGVEMTHSPEEPGNVSPVAATVLYMPGHYDVLYAS